MAKRKVKQTNPATPDVQENPVAPEVPTVQSEPVEATILNPTNIPTLEELTEKVNKMEDVLNRLVEGYNDKADKKAIDNLRKNTSEKISKLAKNTADAIDKFSNIAKCAASRDSVQDAFAKVNTRFQKLEHPKAVVIEIMSDDEDECLLIPEPAKDGSIGDDLITTKDIWLPHGRSILPLGIRINLPQGIEGKIEARSGFSAKGILGTVSRLVSEKFFGIFHRPAVEVESEERVDADVLTGKVDPGYHDGIGVIIKNNGLPFCIPAGTHIAQITYYSTVPHTYKKVTTFSNEAPYVTNRDGGFGSSDQNPES